jgi:uncharacterized protein (TIGR03435 family)
VSAVALALWPLVLFAQQPARGPSFEVVSIKRSDPGATSERYDLVATPPANTSRDKLLMMWKVLWTERMRLRAHLETRERPAYALILARSDGRLGPNLRPATVDCAALAAAAKGREQQGGGRRCRRSAARDSDAGCRWVQE